MEDLDKFMSDFFCLVSTFCYDKAKEMVERERVMSRPGYLRAFFIQLLNLCEAEKTYYNLGFLSTKTKIFVNLRKDWIVRTLKLGSHGPEGMRKAVCSAMQLVESLPDTPTCGECVRPSSVRTMYEGLRLELHRLEGLPSSSNDPVALEIEKTVTPLASQLCHFATARQQLIDLYEKIYNVGIGTKHIKYEELRGQIEAIIEMHVLPHPLLSSIRNCITWECESLMHCLGAQSKMEEWTMLPSLMNLHAAHNRLTQWEKSIQVKESWKIGFLKSLNQPLLYQWLWRFRAHLVNKFTLYFYLTLAQQTTPQEMRNYLSSKNNTDLYIKLHNLQKKCMAGFVALIFDPRGLPGWRGPGYFHPARPAEALPDHYMLMLSQPVKIGERMSGVSRALDGRSAELISPDKPYLFYNSEEKCSYLMWSIEPRVNFVVFYEGKREDKSANIPQITEFCSQIRGTSLLASLKPSK